MPPISKLRDHSDELVALYEAGAYGTDLAKRYSVSNAAVYDHLRGRGIQIRPRGSGKKCPRHLTPEREQELIAHFKANKRLSLDALAAEFDVARSTVRRTLERHGVPREPCGPRKNPLPVRDRVPTTNPRITACHYLATWIPRDHPFADMCQGRGWVLEHRLVVARALGRPLRSTETVHHRNGNRQDNRIENLELRQGQHGRGQCWQCLDCGSKNVAAV